MLPPSLPHMVVYRLDSVKKYLQVIPRYFAFHRRLQMPQNPDAENYKRGKFHTPPLFRNCARD